MASQQSRISLSASLFHSFISPRLFNLVFIFRSFTYRAKERKGRDILYRMSFSVVRLIYSRTNDRDQWKMATSVKVLLTEVELIVIFLRSWRTPRVRVPSYLFYFPLFFPFHFLFSLPYLLPCFRSLPNNFYIYIYI